MMINIDRDQRDADWIRVSAWDFPTDLDMFLQVIGGREMLEHFMTLPAAEAMPIALQAALSLNVPMQKHLPGQHDQLDHGNRGTDHLSTKDWAEGLSHDTRFAIGDYSTVAYHGVNSYLRGGEAGVVSYWERSEGYTPDPEELRGIIDDSEETISRMDEAFSTAPPVGGGTTAYRGMVLKNGVPEVGDTFTDAAFVSTSVHKDAAEKFADWAKDTHDPGQVAVASIILPPETRVVDMLAVYEATTGWGGAQATEERELIMDRGTTFKIVSVELVEDGSYRLGLEPQ